MPNALASLAGQALQATQEQLPVIAGLILSVYGKCATLETVRQRADYGPTEARNNEQQRANTLSLAIEHEGITVLDSSMQFFTNNATNNGDSAMSKPLIQTLLCAFALTAFTGHAQAGDCPDHLQGEYRRLHSSEMINLCERFASQPLLVVNTASHCGFTPQFEALEAVHQRYGERGLAVVGFASDDFNQEADTEEEAAEVCYENFGVTFTMLAPTSVRGDSANPLFRELAAQTAEPAWNFNKYLVGADGEVLAHFGSRTSPEDEEVTQLIESLLE